MKDGHRQIYFTETDHWVARLTARLNYDNMKRTEFFKLFCNLYLEKDQRMLDIIKSYKQERDLQTKEKKKQTRQTQKMYDMGRELEEKFALNEDEIQSIFDLLAREHPDL